MNPAVIGKWADKEACEASVSGSKFEVFGQEVAGCQEGENSYFEAGFFIVQQAQISRFYLAHTLGVVFIVSHFIFNVYFTQVFFVLIKKYQLIKNEKNIYFFIKFNYYYYFFFYIFKKAAAAALLNWLFIRIWV